MNQKYASYKSQNSYIIISGLKFFLFSMVSLFVVTSSAGQSLYLKVGKVNIKELTSNISDTSDTSTRKPTRYFILQYKNKIMVSDQQQLQSLGVEVLRYIPDDAYVVRADKNTLNQIRLANVNVLDFTTYHPDLRLSEGLRVRSVFNSAVYKNVRLQLFSGVHAQTLVLQLVNEGFNVFESSDSTVGVRAQVKDLGWLAQLEGVEWLTEMPRMQLRQFMMPKAFDDQENPRFSTNDFSELTGYESGTKVMNFERAWAAGYKGQGQLVGVADTGLDTGDKATLSSDFANHYTSFVLGNNLSNWSDYMGHGTHVMGSVGGVGANSNGLVTGGATESQLVAQSLWSIQYKNLIVPGDLKIVFSQAYRAGVRIHSNSWGDPESKGVYSSEASQVDQFVWDNPDMVILFAAGNDGVDADADGRIDPGSVSAPATSKNIISVGASENLVHKGGVQLKLGEIKFDSGKPWPSEPIASDTISNNPDGIAAFSSRGPTLDGRIKPDVVAPGTNILSECSHMKDASELWGRYNADYCFSGGTSMATPLAAGAAAIIRQRLIDLNQPNPSAAMVKAVMLHTATDLYPGQYGEMGERNGQEILKRGFNSAQGYGRVNAALAVTEKFQFQDDKIGVATGEDKSIQIQGRLAKVTLVYSDAPGAPEAEKALVNNLDLEVHTADGQLISSSASLVDNTEQIVFDRPVDEATIVVRGTSVNIGRQGKQPFAIIYSSK